MDCNLMEGKSQAVNIRSSWDKLESLMNTPIIRKTNRVQISSNRASFLTSSARRTASLTMTSEPRYSRNSDHSKNPSYSHAHDDSIILRRSLTIKEQRTEIPLESIKALYSAKCTDLLRDINKEQEELFIKNFQQFCSSRILNLSSMNLAEASAKVISEILSSCNCLSKVNIGKNHFGNRGCLEICTSIKKNTSIIEIVLSNNDITATGATDIVKQLINDHLISINLSSDENLHKNTLGTCAGIEKLFMQKTLNFLNLSGTKISEQNFVKISKSMMNNVSLIVLNLSGNKFLTKAFKQFIESLISTKIEELFISNCRIKDKHYENLSYLLRDMLSLKRLDLSNNLFTNEGISNIFKEVQYNTCLKFLNISKSHLSKGLPENFYQLCVDNHTLTELNLSNCDLHNNLHILIDSLTKADTLKKLDLSFNSIKNKGAEFLSKGLSLNKSLISLNLSFNKIKNKGGCSLAKALQENSFLQELNLKENGIKNKAAELLNNVCRTNTKITKLNLKLNPIHVKYTQSINQILEKRQEKLACNNIPVLKKKIVRLRKEKDENNKIFKKIEKKNKEHKIYLEKFEQMNDKLSKLKEEQKASMRTVKNQLFVVQIQHSTKKGMYNNVCKELTELQNNSTQKTKKIEKDIGDVDSHLISLTNHKKKIELKVQKIKGDYDELKEQYKTLIEYNESLHKSLPQLKKELQQLQHELDVAKHSKTKAHFLISEKIPAAKNVRVF
ncbi:hypothetical protein SteCoe_4596 [Stentor coeruleus]|uniref:Uncharacterized protein n=1 Tax=Stentor coeruleus TaxID=5963 RepID=A0A1R2CU97_9CILI|nr:hypothetical protein SteCoe_4596 [Stentor coeruleus]